MGSLASQKGPPERCIGRFQNNHRMNPAKEKKSATRSALNFRNTGYRQIAFSDPAFEAYIRKK